MYYKYIHISLVIVGGLTVGDWIPESSPVGFR